MSLPTRASHSSADFALQFDLSRRMWELMEATAASFENISTLERQLAQRKKALPASPSKELSDAFADLEKQIKELQSGSDPVPGYGTLNRNVGRYLVMVQGGDIAPTESVRKMFQTACEAFAKDTAAEGKLAGEAVPAVNKLIASEKLGPITFDARSAAVPACAP